MRLLPVHPIFRDLEKLGCGFIKAKRQSGRRSDNLGHARQEGAASTFVGMTGFGASGPAEKFYDHFNIATKAVNAAPRARENNR
jgi:hypothetical protein